MEIIFFMIALSAIKILDNLIITARNIFTYQNKKLLATSLVIVSQFIFYFIVKQVIIDASILSVVVVSFSGGIGTYIAFTLNDKFKKDILYTNILTSSVKEDIMDLSEYLRIQKIKHVINDSYTKEWDKTFSVIVFAKTKEESKELNKYLKEAESKFLREILR